MLLPALTASQHQSHSSSSAVAPIHTALLPADNCVFNGGTQLFPAKLTATYTWIATSPGTYYFKCTVTDHCKSGKMKQKVTVVCPAAVKPKATVKSAAGVLTAAEFVHSG